MDRFQNHLSQAVSAKIGKKIGRAEPGPGHNFIFHFRPGRARAKISISLSGRAGLDLNYNFFLWLGPSEIFFLYFWQGWAKIVVMRAGPGLNNMVRADLYIP